MFAVGGFTGLDGVLVGGLFWAGVPVDGIVEGSRDVAGFDQGHMDSEGREFCVEDEAPLGHGDNSVWKMKGPESRDPGPWPDSVYELHVDINSGYCAVCTAQDGTVN